MWSLGVILYILLSGNPPFDASGSYEVYQEKYLRFPQRKWHAISQSAIDLVKLLLKTDPEQRISVVDACNHEWILQHDGDTHVNPLDDPKLPNDENKASTASKVDQTNQGRNTVEMPGTRGANDVAESPPPQSVLESPTPKQRMVQHTLNRDSSPRKSFEVMTPNQAANLPSHEKVGKLIATDVPVVRESLFTLVKQLSKEDKKNESNTENNSVSIVIDFKSEESDKK